MRTPQLRLSLEHELIVDQFAGGGGASLGIEIALGRSPDIAINHDPEAIALHSANHPSTLHHCEDVFKVDPVTVCGVRPVGLMWLSPDCKHFSKAKGGKPVEKKIRGLAWLAVKWGATVKPRVIILENVEEFQDWGPLTVDNKPCPKRKGLTFQRWKRELQKCGYVVEHRELRACDYGAPTIRKRLFLIARRDGLPIVWPEPTHGKGLKPYRSAAECIDWSLPCPSIFERVKPLADNTLKRIAAGVVRYVINSPKPFIVQYHAPKREGDHRNRSIDEPLNTQSTENRFGLVAASVTRIGQTGGNGAYAYPADAPITTITSKAEHLVVGAHLVGAGGPTYSGKPASAAAPFGALTTENHRAVVAPVLVQTGYGERDGQAPRALDIEKPLGTVVGGGQKHALVAAFMAQHNTGMVGHTMAEPVSTIVGKGCTQALASSHLLKLRGTCKDGQPVDDPMPTLTAGGWHVGEVRAFLQKYYGTPQDPNLREPLHTVTTKDRFSLVMVDGEPHYIADIGMRMLQPRELYRAQGFPDDYRIDVTFGGSALTKSAQVRMCGNSVCPPVAAAVIAANFSHEQALREVA